MKETSLYIHIPFCKQKCFYCDFPSFAGKEKYREDYIEALCKEILDKCQKYKIKSIFIGGGTPSYLEVHEIKKLLETVNKLQFADNMEFTMECNPGTVNEEKLIAMKDGGINRISFGLQSCNNELLKVIGRIHTYEEFVENYKLARKLGFNNINVDLMYGLPNLTVDLWKDTLAKICSLKPEHISAYSLIIEEGTAFYTLHMKDKLNLPSEEEEREMDKLTKDVLGSGGYHQYEISNYSLEGRECEHNKVYWKLKEYIGVGSSSSSYIDGFRIVNDSNVKNYIEKMQNNETVEVDRYKNTIKDEMEEYMFMGLRLNEGVSKMEFNQKFNTSIDSIYGSVIEKNIKRGLLQLKGDKLSLTVKGISLANEAMSDFILEK